MLKSTDYEKLSQFLQSNYRDSIELFINNQIDKKKDRISNIPIRNNEDIYVSCELKGEIRALKNLLSSIEESIKDFNSKEGK